MNRVKESGASYRKRKRMCEEQLNKQKGSFLKYLKKPTLEVSDPPRQEAAVTSENLFSENATGAPRC